MRISSPSAECNCEALPNPLQLEETLLIGLYCSPEIQTKLAQLPIFTAETEQLRLAESPQLGFGMLFPIESPQARIGYELKASFNAVNLFQLPYKNNVANSKYQVKKQETLSGIMQILTDIKISFYKHQAAVQLQAFWRTNLKAAAAVADLSKAQHQAGNVSRLEKSEQLIFLKMAQLESLKADNHANETRLALATLLNVSLKETVEITHHLKDIPKELPELSSLKKQAKAYQPDLVALRQNIQFHQQEVKLAKTTFFPKLHLGVTATWSPEGNKGVGPFIDIELPFFGQQRTALQKVQAELASSQIALLRTEQSIQNHIENLHQKMIFSHQMVHFYKNDLLPLKERILKESLKHYNYMLLSNYKLLANKQSQIHTQIELIEALRDFWITYAEIEQSVGGKIQTEPGEDAL